MEYLSELYAKLRSGVVPHAARIDESNVHLLDTFDFVFVCADKGSVRKAVLQALADMEIPLVDVGMGGGSTADQSYWLCVAPLLDRRAVQHMPGVRSTTEIGRIARWATAHPRSSSSPSTSTSNLTQKLQL